MVIRQAVILAAGKGRRMKENATDEALKTLPKPLLDVNGEPMIEGKIRALVENGVEVCIVINPFQEAVFREKLKGYNIRYCHQAMPLGTANALYSAKDFVKDNLFLVMMGDDVIDCDMSDALSGSGPAVFGFAVGDVSGYGALVVDDSGNVSEIIEKRLTGKGLLNCGMYVMPKLFFNCYDEIKQGSAGEDRLTDAPKVLSRHGVRFKLKMLDYWYGVNTPVDLSKANDLEL